MEKLNEWIMVQGQTGRKRIGIFRKLLHNDIEEDKV